MTRAPLEYRIALIETLLRRSRTDDALAQARALARDAPRDVRARTALGQALRVAGQDRRAAQELRAALRLDDAFIPALAELAVLDHAAGRLDKAEAALGKLITLQPNVALFHLGLGNIHRDRNEHAPARAAYTRALELDSDLTDARLGLARLALTGTPPDPDEALAQSGAVLQRQDNHPEGLALHARALETAGRGEEAVEDWRALLRQDSGHVAALRRLARLLPGLGRNVPALEVLRRLVEVQPDDARAWYDLGTHYLRLHLTPEAREAFRRAEALDPDDVAASWAALQALPMLYENEDEIEAARREWHEGLARFEAMDLAHLADAGRLNGLLLGPTSFYRHYLDEDLLEPQRRYGGLISRCAGLHLHDAMVAEVARRPRPDGRIRVGFASEHFRRHTVWRLFRRLLIDLDRERFHVTAVILNEGEDASTREAIEHADAALRDRSASLDRWVRTLREADLDALVWLDIGMSPLTQALSPLRLAPLQAMLWGHPVTSGLPNMDLFISSEAMEPEEGQAHYHERLACLPGIGTCYDPPDTEPDTAWEMPWRREPGTVHFVLAQTLMKLLPVHDRLLADIAARLPEARFTVVPHHQPELRKRLHRRMAGAFRERGLDIDRQLAMTGTLGHKQFLGLFAEADIYLDSLGWSGGNTTLEALWCDVPAITCPGRAMRTRHTAGMLGLMGLDELIVPDRDAYVDLAVRLGEDAGRRSRLRDEVAQRKHVLYRDPAPVRALEALLEREIGTRTDAARQT